MLPPDADPTPEQQPSGHRSVPAAQPQTAAGSPQPVGLNLIVVAWGCLGHLRRVASQMTSPHGFIHCSSDPAMHLVDSTWAHGRAAACLELQHADV
jgi:hypothetical protein